MCLSDADRVVAARQMLISVDRDPARGTSEIDAAWDAEITRRVDDILHGKVATIPWSQVMTEARLVAAESL